MNKIATAILFALLAACSSSPPKTNVESIQVVAESNANQNTATALDIVFVYDTAAAGMLPKTGPEWFDKKAALVSGLATSINVVSLQVPPAMTVSVPLPKKYAKAIGVYVYANYLGTAGQPMGNLTPYEQMTIRLTPDNIIYSGN
jgi:type VI secretion system protein